MDEHIRASDADRDATARVLATALAEGRLDLEEYDKRLTTAMRAATMGDLVPVTSDLPAAEPAAEAPAARDKSEGKAPALSERPIVNELRSWAGGAVIMIGIWGVTSAVSNEFLPFWPLIPLGIWLAVLIAGLISPDKEDRRGRRDRRDRRDRRRGYHHGSVHGGGWNDEITGRGDRDRRDRRDRER